MFIIVKKKREQQIVVGEAMYGQFLFAFLYVNDKNESTFWILVTFMLNNHSAEKKSIVKLIKNLRATFCWRLLL